MQIVIKACRSWDEPSHTEPLSRPLSAGQQAANLALLTSTQSSS